MNVRFARLRVPMQDLEVNPWRSFMGGHVELANVASTPSTTIWGDR